LERGYALRIIDQIDPKEIEPEIAAKNQDAEYQQVDIRDFQAVLESCKGVDIIVHLAAIPHHLGGKEPEISQINAGGTFNVVQAAADLGINQVVCASSINFL